MKGLIRRELFLGRKRIILVSLIWLLFVVIGILVRLSMLYGNMAKMPEADFSSAEKVLYYVCLYASVLILMFLNESLTQNIFSDYRTKWSVFGYASPVSEYRYVGAKLLLMTLFSGVTFVLSLVNAALVCSLNDKPLDGKIVLSILGIICIMMPLFSFYLFLAYQLKTPKKVDAIVIGLIAALYAAAIAVTFAVLRHLDRHFPGLSDDEKAKRLGEYTKRFISDAKAIASDLLPFLPILSIAVVTGVYFLCVKAMKRRGN